MPPHPEAGSVDLTRGLMKEIERLPRMSQISGAVNLEQLESLVIVNASGDCHAMVSQCV